MQVATWLWPGDEVRCCRDTDVFVHLSKCFMTVAVGAVITVEDTEVMPCVFFWDFATMSNLGGSFQSTITNLRIYRLIPDSVY